MRKTAAILQIIIAFLVSSTLQAAGDHQASDANIPIEQPLTRPALGLRMAATPFKISGFDPVSQQYFDEGIAAVHGFWTYEAERRFREVMVRQPKHPIPFAFAAFAQKVFSSGNFERGLEYVKLAKEKRLAYASTLTAAEEDWLLAIEALYFKKDMQAAQQEHIERLQSALESSQDASVTRETKAFLAFSAWIYGIEPLTNEKSSVDGKAELSDEEKATKKKELSAQISTMQQKADGWIESVLKDNADHPAHHYKIHLWNNDEDDILARRSALRCGKNNPACAHLWHMPSHIFSNLNDFRMAAFNFEAAHRVDTAYVNALKLPPFNIHNFPHNGEFFLKTLSHSGGSSLALRLGEGFLRQPRAFHSSSDAHDPTDWTAIQLVWLMEKHLLWKEVRTFHQQGLWEGLFTRESDAMAKANLLRLLALAYLDAKDTETAQGYLDQLRNHRLALAQSSAANATAWTEDVHKKEKDTAIWFAVAEHQQAGDIPGIYFTKLQDLDITPLEHVALLAQQDGKTDLARELVKKAIEANPSASVMPRAVEVKIELEDGQEAKAIALWKQTRALIHTSEGVDDIRKSFPFAATLQFQDVKLFEPTHSPRQPNAQDWEVKMNDGRKLKNFGPMEWLPPTIDTKALAATFDPLEKKLQGAWQDAQNKSWRLVILRQGMSCDRCNVAEADFIKNHLNNFKNAGIETLVVATDGSIPDYASKQPISVVIDPEHSVFKLFGAYDEFEEKPMHAVALLDSESRVRWTWRPDHAFTLWQGLLQEAKRQMGHK